MNINYGLTYDMTDCALPSEPSSSWSSSPPTYLMGPIESIVVAAVLCTLFLEPHRIPFRPPWIGLFSSYGGLYTITTIPHPVGAHIAISIPNEHNQNHDVVVPTDLWENAPRTRRRWRRWRTLAVIELNSISTAAALIIIMIVPFSGVDVWLMEPKLINWYLIK